MITDRIDSARLHSDFYRDQFRKTVRWLISAMLIIFALILSIMYFIFIEPVQHYYANSTVGKIMPMPTPNR